MTAEKILVHSSVVQQKAAETSFFRKAEEDAFFGRRETDSFFHSNIQTKLSVSSPGDPEEKEADEVADRVMRMPELKPEEKEEKIQTKAELVVGSIQCKKDQPKLQPKQMGIYRARDGGGEEVAASGAYPGAHCSRKHGPSSLHIQGFLQGSERGPPDETLSFEQQLSSSKGSGSPLPDHTRWSMENRFGADFSNVRIHSDSRAETLSRDIHAQAFTHGADIYFNAGKFSPQTAEGNLLLAHELTHTIQQGASKNVFPITTVAVASKKVNHLNFGGSIPCGYNRKQQDETEGREYQINSKEALGNWHVLENGNLNTASENIVKKKEDEDEEEKLSASKISPVQKKEFEAVVSRETYAAGRRSDVHNGFSVSRQVDHINNPLSSLEDAHSLSEGEEHERGPPVQAKIISNQGIIQRSVIDDALAYVSTTSILGCVDITDFDATQACVLRKAQEVALHIPGYRALGVVLGQDPITGQHIERNGRNFIEAAFDIMPGGNLLYQKLDEQDQLDAAAAWMDEQISRIESLVNGLLGAFAAFWNNLGITDLSSPIEVLQEGAGIVLRFIDHVIGLAVDAAKELLERVKEYLLTKIVDFIKEQTPVYPLLTVILGKDPITDQVVERNGTNILNALLELGGEEGRMQRQQMQDTGTFQRVASYIDEGIAIFSGAYDQIVQSFHTIWDSVGIESLMDPIGTFQQIYNAFAAPIRRVLDFVIEVGGIILQFIKEVLMQRLSAWAQTVRGYHLVTVLIGRDPFTNEVVPRNVENIIRGFMSLMEGGEEQFNQLKESGAIANAAARIDAAVARLNMTPAYIVQLFIDLWNSFGLNDLADPIAAFQHILDRFGEPIGRLIAFVVEIVKIVILVVLQIMNFPFDVINNIITRSMEAFELIKRDPVGFLRNILRAIKQGFIQFFDNIATHLLNGLTGWLLHELKDANVSAPTDFSLGGIISWVLEILGISKEKIWEKLAAHPRIGPSKVEKIKGMIDKLEGIWTFIRDVQERGISAIWDKIKEQLSNLWSIVLQAITKWVMEKIIIQVTLYLLGLLDPTFIMSIVNSVIIIYRSIRSFIRYAEQMLNVLNSFVNGVADIAAGNIATAANYLENTMDKAMPVVIGFLADLVGLGGAGRKVAQMIESVREMVDKALTWLVNKAVDMGMALLDKVIATGKAVAGAVLDWWKKRKEVSMKDGKKHTIYLEGSGDAYRLMINSTPEDYTEFITKELRRNGITAPTAGSIEQRALLKAGEIDRELGRYKKVKQADRVEWGEMLSVLIDELADLTGQLNINWNVPDPPSIVRWGATNSDGFATMMSAELLSENYVKGEPADEEKKAVVGWDYARSLQAISKKGEPTPQYVKGHLLNENIGGPANVTNLTPITQDMNKEHLNTVEKDVKKLITGKESAADKDPTPKKVVNYSVDVRYEKHPRRTSLVNTYAEKMWQVRRDHSIESKKSAPDPVLLSQYRTEDEAAMNILALLTYEENSLTTGFGCQWEQLEYNAATSKWEPVPDTLKFKPIVHILPQTVEHYKPVFETFKTDIPE